MAFMINRRQHRKYATVAAVYGRRFSSLALIRLRTLSAVIDRRYNGSQWDKSSGSMALYTNDVLLSLSTLNSQLSTWE
jgi:hypothetical protein